MSAIVKFMPGTDAVYVGTLKQHHGPVVVMRNLPGDMVLVLTFDPAVPPEDHTVLRCNARSLLPKEA